MQDDMCAAADLAINAEKVEERRECMT